MKTIVRQAVVPFTPQQMFDLINNVARYPEFVPHCTQADILKATPSMMEARLCFSKGILQQTFTTRNILTAPAQIHMQLVDGPFRRLQGEWSFEAHNSGGSQVSLTLQFAFKNALLDMTFGAFFQQIGSQLVDCFSQRAVVVYGR